MSAGRDKLQQHPGPLDPLLPAAGLPKASGHAVADQIFGLTGGHFGSYTSETSGKVCPENWNPAMPRSVILSRVVIRIAGRNCDLGG